MDRKMVVIDLSCDTICQGKLTIDKLLKCLLKEKIILIRSPPMAGKTTLAQLFENSLLNSDEEDDEWTFAEGFKCLMNMTWFEFLNSCNVKTFLIIDEAQKMYTPINRSEPLHGGNVFWESFKDVQRYLKLYLPHMDFLVPTILKDLKMPISLKKNSKTIFNKFCKKKLSMLDEKDLQSIYHYLYVITGLPGLAAYTMDKIYDKFTKHVSLSFEKNFSYLNHNFCAVVELIRASSVITDD
ncbi:hypothetical protein RhiirC2_779588 [Rhizophagus irregularis]|uniref:Uncharacterized protein n=1 Tax=Rhizophagus irregularis TaxID=588596 RepID=A0A2N1N9B4_9GLOM|nr:hypothetical protein RhiirC2_779588 [Rhizophagus irregularis]